MGSEKVRYGPGKEEEGNVEGYIDMMSYSVDVRCI